LVILFFKLIIKFKLKKKFLLDGSGSVGGNTFQTQMEILDKLIDILEIGPGQNQSQLAVMQ